MHFRDQLTHIRLSRQHWSVDVADRFAPSKRARMLCWPVIACVAAIVIACGGSGSGIDQPVGFISNSVPGALHVLEVDGTVSIVSDNAVISPKWAPNSARLAFITGAGDGGGQLMIWNRGENSIETIPGGFDDVTRHFWAPDSLQISFEANVDGESAVYVYTADGTNSEPVRVTSEPVGNIELGNWSGDNQWITLRLVTRQGAGIFRRNVDGVDEVRLTTGDDFAPRFSPDGSRVAFRRRLSNGSTDIFAVNAQQANDSAVVAATNLTNLEGNETSFAWSPNGRYIAFVTEKDGNSEIYSLDTETRSNTRLTQNRVQDLHPAWSRSGGNILFVSDADGDFDLFSLTFESGDQRRLHATSDSELFADW